MEWFHTLVLIIHILGAALIIGVSFSSLVIQLKKPTPLENLKIIEKLYKTIQIVFVTQLLSGLYLAYSEWDKFSSNPLVSIKFTLFFIAAGGAFIALRNDKKKAQQQKVEIVQPNSVWVWVTLLIFLTIATLGVILAESAS